MIPVLRRVPGQDEAIQFLERAAKAPRHAYLFAGPEGSGKQLAARAFTAALLCARGGCGECRDCRLALEDRHPNVVLVEPEGRDIRVGTGPDDDGTARWMAARAALTAPEPGRKVFRIDQADRLTEEAADVLLKVLEEAPAETVFVLSSARPDEIPETVRSRCQAVAFRPLPERFVVETLEREGVEPDRARLAARLAGGNLGRARRIATDPKGLAFRDAALEALEMAERGSGGALDAADRLIASAAGYRKRLATRLRGELDPFTDPDTGLPLEQYRASVRRLKERHARQERRAEREFLDWSLLALEAWFRDAMLAAAGGDRSWAINVDRAEDAAAHDADVAARAVAALEAARAALADETNLNARLVLEDAFLELTAALRPAA
ncbi:MAG TPA: DNA polymerase III subunit [Actinomycetota bacterium]|nr:DNA polymerase III subunit [Actinomycetota bacterium]